MWFVVLYIVIAVPRRSAMLKRIPYSTHIEKSHLPLCLDMAVGNVARRQQ